MDCEVCRYWWVLNELNGDGACRWDIRAYYKIQTPVFALIIIPMPPLGIYCSKHELREYPELESSWKEWGAGGQDL